MKHTTFSHFRSFLALTLASSAVLPTGARAESELDFKLINDTGYEINKVFIAPSKSDD